MSELVSIILPTYNRDYILAKAIDSVLAQTYSPCELIIVDDGSADQTKELVNCYSDQIRYIWQPNQGQASALNLGMSLAQGAMVGFIDSDDRFKSNHVEVLARALKSGPYQFVLGSIEVNPPGQDPLVADFFDPTKLIRLSETECSMGRLFGWREIFQQTGEFKGLFPDTDMFQRLKAQNFLWKTEAEKTYEYYFGICADSVILKLNSGREG